MKSAFSVLALAAAANASCAPGQWNTADNDALLCDQEQCGVQCFGNVDCVTRCMAGRNPTYDACGIECASNAVGCGLDSCFLPCIAGCNDRCVRCTAPACGPSYAQCLGVSLGEHPTTCCPAKNDAFSAMPATPTSWEDCTLPTSPIANREMTFDPAVPVKGRDNMIYLTGDLLDITSVSDGTCGLKLSWNGVTVLNDSFSVCGNQTVSLPLNMGHLLVDALKCPQSPGPLEIDITAQLSRFAPSGRYSINADCFESSGAPLICVDVSLRL